MCVDLPTICGALVARHEARQDIVACYIEVVITDKIGEVVLHGYLQQLRTESVSVRQKQDLKD
jgi:hypothetical protein